MTSVYMEKRQIAIPITGRNNSCKNCHSNCRPPISIMAAKYSQRSHDIIRCTTGLQNYVRSILNGHPEIGDIIRPNVVSYCSSTPSRSIESSQDNNGKKKYRHQEHWSTETPSRDTKNTEILTSRTKRTTTSQKIPENKNTENKLMKTKIGPN